MTCLVDRNADGEHAGDIKSMTFSCDYDECDVAVADKDIMLRGGLTAMGWDCSGGSHFCPEHRRTPLPTTANIIADIARERDRQILVEGFTPESNDHYAPGTLAAAAACYAAGEKLSIWPWGDEWWKPGPDRRRDMEKAGALIAAEIEHIDRTSTEEQTSGN